MAESQRRWASCFLLSLMSMQVMTTPAMLSSVVRYGDMRTRNHFPSVLRISLSNWARSRSTRVASAVISGYTRLWVRSESGLPSSAGMKLKSPVEEGVKRLMRRSRSRKMVAMRVADMRLWRSLLARPSSSTFPFISRLMVMTSSLMDWSSSRPVSISSVAERSSSFMAWSSSLEALSSSTEASYCSTVSRQVDRTCPAPARGG